MLRPARKRLGIQQKQSIVLRLLEGHSIQILADEVQLTPDDLLDLKRRFIRAGREGLKTRRSSRP